MIKNKLGNFVKIRTGKLDANASSIEGEYPFFTCSKEPLKISSYSFDCKCVLVAGNGDLNVKYYEGKFDAYQRTYIIESKDESILDTRYLYWFLFKYLEKLRELSIGGVIKYIKLNNLTDPIIPLLPLEDQKRIVKILDDADTLRQKRKQTINLLDDYLRAMFLKMFGDPVKNPKGWDKFPLKSVVDIQSGQVNPKIDPYASMIHIGGADVESETGNIINKITARDAGQISGKYLFDESYLLYSKIRPYLNKVSLPNFSGICSADIYPIKPKESLNKYFLAFILKSNGFLEYANKNSGRSSIPKINRLDLLGYELIVPAIDLQNIFEKVWKETETLKHKMLSQAEELENQFQALMQKAFKGNL
jgi:type I restriction enzyme S subunit